MLCCVQSDNMALRTKQLLSDKCFVNTVIFAFILVVAKTLIQQLVRFFYQKVAQVRGADLSTMSDIEHSTWLADKTKHAKL